MSFRRELVVAAGGFRIGYSCDDTKLCIRMRQAWPEKRFVFVPEARVEHGSMPRGRGKEVHLGVLFPPA